MSKMADLTLDIEEMLEKGNHPATISAVLDVPVSWVYQVLDNENKIESEEFNPFLTVNS